MQIMEIFFTRLTSQDFHKFWMCVHVLESYLQNEINGYFPFMSILGHVYDWRMCVYMEDHGYQVYVSVQYLQWRFELHKMHFTCLNN